MRIIILSLMIFLIGNQNIKAQEYTNDRNKEYIEKYKDIALKEQIEFGIPASITLAQGLLESDAGESMLALVGNNHFGIKCGGKWTGPAVFKDDDSKNECFRKYESAEESYKDHSQFLKNNKRYSNLFLLPIEDYTSWAKVLKEDGYATDKNYPAKLIQKIEAYNLNQYIYGKNNTIARAEQKSEEKVEPVIKKIEEKLGVKPKENKKEVVYPKNKLDSVFYVNNIKSIWAPKGTSLINIALANKMSLKKLMAINDLEEDMVPEDNFIFLKRKNIKGLNSTYTVRESDISLWDIAQKNAIQLSSLRKFNNLAKADIPLVGELLHLRDKNPLKIKVKTISDNYIFETPKVETPKVENKILEQPKEYTPSKVEVIKREVNLENIKTYTSEINENVNSENTNDNTATEKIKETIDNTNENEENKIINAKDNSEKDEVDFTQLIHVVGKGENLNQICMLYRVNKSDLMKKNNLKSEEITEGMQLYIPNERVLPTAQTIKEIKPVEKNVVKEPTKTEIVDKGQTSKPVKQNPIKEKIHTVVAGETLFRIAVNYKTAVQDIIDANPGLTTVLEIGQKIVIPPYSGQYSMPNEIQNTSPTKQAPTNTASTSKTLTHTVSAGENMYRISIKYGVSIQDILKWNNLSSESVYVGQHLKILNQ